MKKIYSQSKKLGQRVIEKYYKMKYDSGIHVMEKDWDNLIILDACRYDYFEKEIRLDGKLNSVISQGSTSWQFIENNFVDREFLDTVYVSSNPHIAKINNDAFYHINMLLNKWDSELQTIFPAEVVDASIETHRKFPDKRIIIHFMQPHAPYIGPTGDEIRNSVDDLRGWDRNLENLSGTKPIKAAQEGKISKEMIRKAYSENLNIVLSELEDLLPSLHGKTVITADHGELLGDRSFIKQLYGHPPIYAPELRKVPWFIIDNSDRRKITHEKPEDDIKFDKEKMNEQLEALGYR